jgi:4-amino-4-deoxy-L-arabinose transferase-like glycosyltransferase
VRGNRRHHLRPSSSRAALIVAAILVAALALRVAYVETTSYRAVNDAGTYNRFAATIASHGDYETGDGPGTGAGGSRGPTAYFPPAYPYLLSVADLIDGHTTGHRAALEGERLAGAVLGTVAVGLTGLVALELFGAGAALAALLLAAIYPVAIELSGALVAENLLVVLELAAVWTALRAGRSGRPVRWVAATGALSGLAALTHENAALLVLPLAVAAARSVGAPGRRRVVAVAVLLLAAAAVITPWTIRNAVQLHHFVPVSDETGITLRGTYNPESAAARTVPYKWRFFWSIPQDAGVRHHAGTMSEVALGDVLEHRALHYIAAHPAAPLDAGWHNLTRMFELEGSSAWHASAAAIDLGRGDAEVGVIAFWVLCLLAIGGMFTRAARTAPKWPWAVPALFALSVLFVNVETPRFREPIDPFLVLLAAAGVSALAERMRSSRR